MEHELSAVELAAAKLARVNVLLNEASTILAIEDANRRATLNPARLTLQVHSLDKLSNAIVTLAASLVQAKSSAPVAAGTSEKAELSAVAKDVQSVLENLGEKPEQARAFVLAAIDQVGDSDFEVLVSAALKMVGQTKMGGKK